MNAMSGIGRTSGQTIFMLRSMLVGTTGATVIGFGTALIAAGSELPYLYLSLHLPPFLFGSDRDCVIQLPFHTKCGEACFV